MSENKTESRLWINYKSLKSRITLSFLLLVIFMILFTWLSYYQANQLLVQQRALSISLKNAQEHTSSLIESTNRSNLLLQHQLIDRRTEVRPLRKKIWRESIQTAMDSLEAHQAEWNTTQLKLKFATILMDLKKLKKYQDEVETLIRQENQAGFVPNIVPDVADNLSFNTPITAHSVYQRKLSSLSETGLMNQLHLKFEEFEVLQMLDYQNRQEALNKKVQFYKILGLVLLILLIAVITYVGFTLANRFEGKISQLRDYVWAFSKGNIPDQIEATQDETGQVLLGLQELADNLIKIKEFARTVGDGKFDKDINIFDNQGELGRSLSEMHNGLVAVAIRDRQRNWINEGIALFGSLLREYSDAQVLYDKLIANLVKYLKANQGGIFVLNDQIPDQPILELMSVYAYDRKRFVEKTVRPGQGLIGQAWLEKEVIYLEQASENYVQIVSGLGGANPRSVLISPMINNEAKVLGTLEIASFHHFEAYEIEFVKRVSEMIVAAISALKNNEKNRLLLEEAQRATEQMRQQDQEMRNNLKELMITQEEMKKNQAELKGQTTAIDSTLATAELDLDGNFVKANEIFLEAVEYHKEELIGQPYSVLVDDRESNSPEYQQFWQNLLEGKTQHAEIKRMSKYGQDVWFNATFTLIRDEKQRPKRIIKLAMEITEQKRLSLNYKNQLEAINKSNALLELNTQGFIISANEIFLRLMGYKLEELKGVHHDILLPGEEKTSPDHKQFWEKLSKGEHISGKFKRISKNGREIWIRGSYNAIFDLDGHLYKILELAQDVTHEVDVESQIDKAEEIMRKQKSELLVAREQLKRKDEALAKAQQQLKAWQEEASN